MDITALVKAIVPDMPADRKVVPTLDWGSFYKINYERKVLYVPTDGALRMQPQLLDQFLDAVKAFASAAMVAPDWTALSYDEDEGNVELALGLLRKVPHAGFVSCDIESRNVSFRDNQVLDISFCWSDNYAIVISALRSPLVVAAVQEVLSRPNVHWIWQNGKFDIGRLAFLEGIHARVDEDTMLLHYACVNEIRGTHGLKEMGALFLQAPEWEAELDQYKREYCRSHKITQDEFDYSFFPARMRRKYASIDAIMTYRLYFVLRALARVNSEQIYRKLIEASNVYSAVERAGVYVDMDYLEELEVVLEQKIQAAQEQFNESIATYWNPLTYMNETGAKSIPKKFNLASPIQLRWLLQKVTGEKLTSTSKDVIEDLITRFGDDLPVIQALSNLRKFSKYMDTYIAGYRSLLCSDGRIHCTYNLHGTETGRLSASDPNMQNIPRDKTIKNLFVAAPGFKFVQFDYSQAELRVLAYLSQDEFLKNVYKEGRDLHDSVATQMFGPNFNKEQRVQAKTINFGIPYGRGPSAIAQKFKMSMPAAKALVDNWFEQMPGVKSWITEQRQGVYSLTPPSTILGRERHFVITSENFSHVQNEMVNFKIQSLASDMTLLSLLAIYYWIEAEGLQDDVRIIISVHDSIVLEVRDNPELVRKVAKKGTQIMMETPIQYLPNLDFPFVADVETGYKWGELHEEDA